MVRTVSSWKLYINSFLRPYGGVNWGPFYIEKGSLLLFLWSRPRWVPMTTLGRGRRDIADRLCPSDPLRFRVPISTSERSLFRMTFGTSGLKSVLTLLEYIGSVTFKGDFFFTLRSPNSFSPCRSKHRSQDLGWSSVGETECVMTDRCSSDKSRVGRRTGILETYEWCLFLFFYRSRTPVSFLKVLGGGSPLVKLCTDEPLTLGLSLGLNPRVINLLNPVQCSGRIRSQTRRHIVLIIFHRRSTIITLFILFYEPRDRSYMSLR